ncbi:mesogenin-1-like [Myripristis murdjan]|uniref:mesogenin-1-like n=1 Tax=Myripristis murdjan TaxID=586833 RepID=UPI001175FBA4|nr:mesogenin-1-like [Myripristis murdjan]
MDTSSVPLLDYSLQYQWCSDSDLSSISSPETLSPVPSMDSSLSPSYQQPVESTLKAAKTGYSQSLKPSAQSPSRSIRKPGRARMPRIRSKQRESASEKEKLRMRDLTKALHHLRTYLPPSVAPAGQTLTKIETLRLTIRYISYLSAQLGLSEEVLFQRREQGDRSTSDASSPDILSYFQHGSTGGQWAQSLSHNHGQYQAQCQSQPASLHSGSCSFGVDLRQYSGQYSEASQGDILTASMDTILQSPPATHPSSCQMYGKDFCTPLVPREYWG